MAYLDTSNPVFSELVRKLEVNDRAHADVFNDVFEKLLNNDMVLKEQSAEMTEKQVIEIYANALGIDAPSIGEAISDNDLTKLLNSIFV